MKLLVTGAAGFIGSAFVRYVLRERPGFEVVSYDALTYAADMENIAEVLGDSRHEFVHADVADSVAAEKALKGVGAVVHFAAESHNDRSILDPGIFLRVNALGTLRLMESCRRAGVTRFHHVSTDEVYGDIGLDENRAFKEGDPYRPRSPYSASKAASDHVVESFRHTFGMRTTVSHCCNNYGPHQFPEKLLPLFTTNALQDIPLPLMKSSRNTREWIHADDHSSAVLAILEWGRVGETYNIGTGVERSIEEIADLVLETLGKPSSLKSYVPDRPGHDRRYLLDSSKIRAELGWEPRVDFARGVAETIAWYRDNPNWWRRMRLHAAHEKG